MTSPHVFIYNRWFFSSAVSPLRHPPPKKNAPSSDLRRKRRFWRATEEHGDRAGCEVRRGILVCLSAGSPAQTDTATTLRTDMSRLNVSPEQIFSPFFPFALHLHKPTQLQLIRVDNKEKTLSVFSSYCLHFVGCLRGSPSGAQLCNCGSATSFGPLCLNSFYRRGNTWNTFTKIIACGKWCWRGSPAQPSP